MENKDFEEFSIKDIDITFSNLINSPTVIISFILLSFYNLFVFYAYMSNNFEELIKLISLSSENVFYIPSWFISIIMHGSLIHLFINMIVLISFGLLFERYVSNTVYYLFFIVCGVLSGLSQVLIFMMIDETVRIVGASGSIAGIIGFIAISNPSLRVYLFFILPVKALNSVLLFILGSLVVILLYGLGAFNIAHIAHIVGLLIGIIFGLHYLNKSPYIIIGELKDTVYNFKNNLISLRDKLNNIR